MNPRGLWMDLLDTSESECTKNIPLSAGKTTLLDLLAGRRIKGRISSKSEILYDGHPPTPRYKQHHVGYVEQHDTLLEMMTPYEMLMYTAQLKLSRATSKEEVKIRVQDLIEKLNLNSCQHTVIGPHLRQKISGGEAKRTNIGISMVSNPSVLYIDELTSGLDAYTGHEVARAVKGLSESGITICVSLHSPPPRTFQLFDRLLMMQKGRVLYFGCSGLEVLDYLEQNFPCLQKMEENEGVADYLLDVTNKSDDEGVTNFADAYLKSELYEQNCYIIKNRTRLPEGDIEKNETTSQISKTTSIASQDVPLYQTVEQVIPRVNPTWWALWVMWRYRTLRLWSKLSFIAPRVFEKFMIVFLITTLWWKMNDNMTNGDLGQRAHANLFTSSILFIWSTMSGFSAVALLSVIAEERISTYREMYDGLYSTTTYVIYKLVEEFIPQIIAGLIYSLMVFYILRLNGSYAIFCLVYFASTAIAMACTLAIGAATPDPVISGSIVLAYVTTWFFFSGFLIPFNDIPVYWQWYSVIDPLRYSFGSMMANQFSDNNPDILAGINVLQFYGLEGVNAWAWLGFEFLFIPVFIACFWAAMKWVRY